MIHTLKEFYFVVCLSILGNFSFENFFERKVSYSISKFLRHAFLEFSTPPEFCVGMFYCGRRQLVQPPLKINQGRGIYQRKISP